MPEKTVITIKDKNSNVVEEHTTGNNIGYSTELPPGEYEIFVQSFNGSGIGSNIEKISIRVSTFKDGGYNSLSKII